MLHPRGPPSAHLCPELRRGKWKSAILTALPRKTDPGPLPQEALGKASPSSRARGGWGSQAHPDPPPPGSRARGALGAPVLSLQHFVEGSPWAACKPCPPSERRGKKIACPPQRKMRAARAENILKMFPLSLQPSKQNRKATEIFLGALSNTEGAWKVSFHRRSLSGALVHFFPGTSRSARTPFSPPASPLAPRPRN